MIKGKNAIQKKIIVSVSWANVIYQITLGEMGDEKIPDKKY